MSNRVHAKPVDPKYLKLLRVFPLRVIHTRRDYEAAGRVLNQLLGRQSPPLSTGENDYLDALLELSKAFEAREHRPDFQKFDPVGIVRFLMKEHGLNTEKLGIILGSQTAASLFLNGVRPLSRAHLFRLAGRFKVDAGIFLGAG